MFLYQSNSLEVLLDQLCVVLKQDPAPPLVAETLVVPHLGMAQWIGLQVARKTGIAAHFTFPLPGRFFGEILAELGEKEATANLDRKVMLWRIYNLLPEYIRDARFKEVSHYLQGGNSDIKQYQLADAVSDVFDKYLIYRPDIITRWDKEEDEHWQAVLWRAISQGIEHRVALFQRVLNNVNVRATLPALPQRSFWFGMNALPPIYLELLHQLSNSMEVHLFHLSPCQEFWGDLVSEKQLAKRSPRLKDLQKKQDNYFEIGNPLLSSWGSIGQEFLQLLLNYDVHLWEHYQPDPSDTLLATLHNQLLILEDTTQFDITPQYPLQVDDSLQFHVCHSPFREVQVLHDQLLKLIEENPGLSASDILVAAPDIQVYSAAIRGVFGSTPPNHQLPYYIADATLGQEGISTQGFLDLLQLFYSRCTAPQVMALLEIKPIRARFNIASQDLPLLRQWVQETQIRWGFDVQHRQQFDDGMVEKNTWEDGLDRLLLGYFMGETDGHFNTLYPYAPMGTGDAELLGAFTTFLRTLRRYHPLLSKDHTPAEWNELLLALCHDFFDQEHDPEGYTAITETLFSFSEETTAAATSELLSPKLILHHLTTILQQPASGRAFLTGRVTFCNMVPMRAVPFKVICLLGMNDGAFPRSQQLYSFDHTTTTPRLGDRNRRKDDRYLFLEIFLSARQTLYISWVGKDQRSNEDIPPSIVISELQEYLDRSTPEHTTPLSEQLTSFHPLQPFSPKSFEKKNGKGSYNAAWLPATHKSVPPPFVDELTHTQSVRHGEKSIQLTDLIRFWRHPGRFFLSQLDVRPRIALSPLKEHEPFSLDQLEHFTLRQAATNALLHNHTLDQVEHQLQSEGILPHAGFGRYWFDKISSSSSTMITQLGKSITSPLPPLEVEVTLGPFQLSGWIDSLYSGGRVTWRSASLHGTTLMELWITHLLLQIAAPDVLPKTSRHISTTETTLFTPVAEAEEHVTHLLTFFLEGHTRPLHFFPKSSLEAAKAKPGQEHAKALSCWQGNSYKSGEGEEPEYQLLFNSDPSLALDDEFFALSALFHPLLAHTEVVDATA